MDKVEEVISLKLPLTSLEVSALNFFLESQDKDFITDMREVIEMGCLPNSHTYVCGYLLQKEIDELVCIYIWEKIKGNMED